MKKIKHQGRSLSSCREMCDIGSGVVRVTKAMSEQSVSKSTFMWKSSESQHPGSPEKFSGTWTDTNTDLYGCHVKDRQTPDFCTATKVCPAKPQPIRYLISGDVKEDILHTKSNVIDTGCSSTRCVGSLMKNVGASNLLRSVEETKCLARDFLCQYYDSIKRMNTTPHQKRLEEVMTSIEERGTYELTTSELTFGAKTAWRNSPRCTGRIQWSKLQVFDARHIRTARGMFEAICNHIKFGTNKGNLRSAITIFPPRTDEYHVFRVWNIMIIGYAGYKQEDGSVVGDPMNVEFTELCCRLGWKGKGERFDVLPLVLQADGKDPELFEIPDDLVLQVRLTHPDYPWFEDLGLQWYALPGVASLMLDCGGLQFTAVPFNGWYVSSEIGSRDLCDPNRYNITKEVAERMSLNTHTNASLWKDKAMVEVNIAVLHSYQKAGVTLVDHHTAAETFMKYFESEFHLRGGCPADWVWIVPPISGSLTPVFHQEMVNYRLRPSYEYQELAWKRHVWKHDDNPTMSRHSDKKRKFKDVARVIMLSTKMMRSALTKRIKCTILYATETGTSERYAKTLRDVFKTAFDAKIVAMDEYDIADLEHESLILFVTSTFGNGEPPDNGKDFAKELYAMVDSNADDTIKRPISSSIVQVISQDSTRNRAENNPETNTNQEYQAMGMTSAAPLANVRYSVFALGSTAYPNFCAFGKFLDCVMCQLGAERLQRLVEGDELCGQQQAFNQWSEKTFQAACKVFCVDDQVNLHKSALSQPDKTWSLGKYRVIKANEEPEDTAKALSMIHNKSVQTTRLASRFQLQRADSDRQTILVRLDTLGLGQLRFVPGDHMAVYPANRQELVNAILSKITTDIDPDESISLQIQVEKSTALGVSKNWESADRFPFVTTLRTALTRYLDITTPPSPPLLSQLLNLAADEEDRRKLDTLVKDSRAYDDWKFVKQPTVADVLDEFPSVTVLPTLLLSQLPVLQPRYYSICSSPDMYPGEIHLTVAVVEYKTQSARSEIRYGVCSTWLNRIQPGEAVHGFVKCCPEFHMPENPSIPVIMVGPGTGVAPFRAFWQQRSVDGMRYPDKKYGPMSLYFGCRRSDVDDIYKEEKRNMTEAGILESIPTALSREPGLPKTYVQDLLLSRGSQVFNDIVMKNGHFYVCGDVTMAADVRATLEQIIEKFGSLPTIEAKRYVDRMKEQNLFHEEIFGITLKTSTVNREARERAFQRKWRRIARAATIFSEVTKT